MARWTGLAVALLFAAPRPLQARPLDDLAAAARKGGVGLWYDSSPEEQAAKVVAVFQGRYPGAKVKHIRLVGGVDIAGRMVQEARVKGQSVDVATLAVDQAVQLHGRGLLAEIDWARLGVPAQLAQAPFAVATTSALYVILYNKDQVKADEAPRGWEDLLQPRWKGKVGTWISAQALAQLVPAWGPEKATDYATRFAAQAPLLYQSTFPLAQDVAAGEVPVALGIYHSALPAIAKGAPIAVVLLDPTSKSTIYSVVSRQASHPELARLFVAWLASPEGAKAYEEATGRGNPLLPGTRAAALLASRRLSEFPLARAAEGAQWLARFGELLRRGGKEASR